MKTFSRTIADATITLTVPDTWDDSTGRFLLDQIVNQAIAEMASGVSRARLHHRDLETSGIGAIKCS